MTDPTPAPSAEWVLVPREPTEEMQDAGRDALDGWLPHGHSRKAGALLSYRAMIAASPSPSVERRGLIESAQALMAYDNRIMDALASDGAPHAQWKAIWDAFEAVRLALAQPATGAVEEEILTPAEGHATLIRCVQTMRHALTFITSREKMHPDGVKLYRIDLMCLESLAEDLAQHEQVELAAVIDEVLRG